MSIKLKSRRAIGRQVATPPRRDAVPPAATPATLAEQKADFTAEGAPPPGLVAGSTPAKLPHDEAVPPARPPV